jgi:hypothetical protein
VAEKFRGDRWRRACGTASVFWGMALALQPLRGLARPLSVKCAALLGWIVRERRLLRSRVSVAGTGATLIVSALVSFTAGPAQAAWPTGCTAGEKGHCYVLAEENSNLWQGGLAIIDTTAMSVPNPEADFLDDEMWVSNGERWLETGQTTGISDDGVRTGLHRFYANAGVNESYSEWVESPQISFGVQYDYFIGDPHENKEWQIVWGREGAGWEEPPAHKYFFPKGYQDATDIEVGIEASSNSQPVNEGYQEVAGISGASGGNIVNEGHYPLTGKTRLVIAHYNGNIIKETSWNTDNYAPPFCQSPLAGLTPGDVSFNLDC